MQAMGGGKKRARWIDSDSGDILEWDYQHGRIERYNDKGKHLGEFDPNDGKETKPADAGRSVAPTIWKKRKKGEMVFYLTWFEKDGNGLIGESLLPGVTDDNVRAAFGLEPDEYPGDCLEVSVDILPWLKPRAIGIKVELDQFDYFVEACDS
jgi:hypothetical protein